MYTKCVNRTCIRFIFKFLCLIGNYLFYENNHKQANKKKNVFLKLSFKMSKMLSYNLWNRIKVFKYQIFDDFYFYIHSQKLIFSIKNKMNFLKKQNN